MAGRETSKCKGPEVRTSFPCSRKTRRPVWPKQNRRQKIGSKKYQGICTLAFILSEMKDFELSTI